MNKCQNIHKTLNPQQNPLLVIHLIVSPKYGLICIIWQRSQGLTEAAAQQRNVLLHHILENVQQSPDLYELECFFLSQLVHMISSSRNWLLVKATLLLCYMASSIKLNCCSWCNCTCSLPLADYQPCFMFISAEWTDGSLKVWPLTKKFAHKVIQIPRWAGKNVSEQLQSTDIQLVQ